MCSRPSIVISSRVACSGRASRRASSTIVIPRCCQVCRASRCRSASRQLGEREGEIRQDDAAAARQRQGRQVPEAAAEPQGERPSGSRARQVCHAPGERYAERRRRSRMSSTKIGISESKITTPTTTWMWSPMFGTACAQQVAGPRHARHPCHATGDIVEKEAPVLHLADARHHRGEGADDRDEPGDHDRLGAVALRRSARVRSMWRGVEQQRLGACEEPRPQPPADGVADAVADDGGDDQQDVQPPDVQIRRSPRPDPAVMSSESPGRKNPISSPVSVNTIATRTT